MGIGLANVIADVYANDKAVATSKGSAKANADACATATVIAVAIANVRGCYRYCDDCSFSECSANAAAMVIARATPISCATVAVLTQALTLTKTLRLRLTLALAQRMLPLVQAPVTPVGWLAIFIHTYFPHRDLEDLEKSRGVQVPSAWGGRACGGSD